MAFIKLDYKSEALMRGVSVTVILPTDRMAGREVNAPFKTLYFLPGYSANGNELYTYLSFRKHAELKGIAVVIPDGENMFYVDHPERNTSYSTYAGKELVEVTRRLLPLSEKRGDTFIGGISMGGYGALYNGMRFRRTFSRIAAMSPAITVPEVLKAHPEAGFTKELFENLFWSEEAFQAGDTNILKAFAEADRETVPEVFLCCGKQDVLVYEDNKRFEKFLSENGIGHIYKEEDGNHDLDFWERMMDPAFSFLAGIEEGTRSRLTI